MARLDDNKIRLLCIFDEDDLNTTSCERDNGVIEKLLFNPWNGEASYPTQVLQVISITATVGANAIGEKQPMQIAIMPVRPDYRGLSPLVPACIRG